MCPYCQVKGRQTYDGRPRGIKSAAAKLPRTWRMRASLGIHVFYDRRVTGGAGLETFGGLDRRRRLRKSRTGDALRGWRLLGGPMRWPQIQEVQLKRAAPWEFIPEVPTSVASAWRTTRR